MGKMRLPWGIVPVVAVVSAVVVGKHGRLALVGLATERAVAQGWGRAVPANRAHLEQVVGVDRAVKAVSLEIKEE